MDPPRLSPFSVPTTTSPWIWPYNMKIIRGPLQKFWILPLMDVFRHVYMTNYSYIYFWLLRASSSMILHWCFHYDGWWLIFPILFLISSVNCWLNFLTLDVFLWYVHFLTHLSYHIPFRCLPSGLPLSTLFTLRRVVIFGIYNELIFIIMMS